MCGEWHNIWLDDGFYQGCGYHGVDNPTIVRTFPGTEGVAPFSLFTNGKDGLYVGVHDIEPNVINFVHQLKPGYVDSMRSRISRTDEIDGRPAGFTVGVTRMPYVMPGEKKTLAPVVLSFFEGDWHKGVKPYKKWRDTWFKRVSIPKWAEEMDCWMTLHINSPEGCCRYRYSELPDIAREAKKYGVQALQLIGWAIGGQDGNEPYQDTDPLLGTKDELKNAIKEIEKIGIRVLLMCKFKWCDWEIPEYENELYKHTLKDIYGKPFQFGGYSYQTMAQQLGASLRSGAGLCHSSTDYRKFALNEFDKILDLKPSGILYDELANPMRLCYDEKHDHRFGECNHVGSVKLAREFYEQAVKSNPEFLLTGEGPLDVFTQYYTVNYIRSFDMNHDPANKYMDPDMKFATCLVGFDDREMVNQCVTYGYIINYEPFNFKGRMSDIPKTAEYGMLAQKLRRKLYDYIWSGTFMHTDDAELKVLNENREYIYSVFKNKKNGKRAVVIANQNIDRELQASVALSDSSNKFTVYSIENDETCDYNNLVEIKPRSLAVLVEV